jgi:hypothetical protein
MSEHASPFARSDDDASMKSAMRERRIERPVANRSPFLP